MFNMSEQSLLIGISQLAIVFSGLISVFIIFAARDGKFVPAERQHVRGLLISSFPAVIASLTPFAFQAYGAPEAWIWKGSAIVMLAFGIPMSVENFMHYLKLSKADKKENGYAHAIFSFVLNFIIGTQFVLTAFGVAAKANYIVAILLTLLTGISSFVTFAWHRFLRVHETLPPAQSHDPTS